MIKWSRTKRWSMRLIIWYSQKEILILKFIQVCNSPVGATMRICKFFWKALCVWCLWISRAKFVFIAQLTKISSHIIPIFWVPSIWAYTISKIIRSIKVPFSDIAAFNLVIVQTLSDCLYVISHSDTVCDNSIGVWKCSSKNCTSCRTTYRLTGISILITDALLCQSVKIWRLHLFISITANHIFSCCVCHQYYNLLFHSCSPFHSHG